MAPSSPSNSSNSSEASSPNVNEASSSLFLSLNAKSEPNSPESDSSPIETSIITQSTTTTTLENNNINTLSSVANNSATTNATHSSSNKSSPSSHDDEKSASSQAITKPGNSSTVKKAVGTTNGVNSASDSSSSTVIPQQYHQSTIPTATTSATPNTTNTSTTTTSSPSSGVQPSTPNKPVLVQSKKAIHPHQPMNAYLPPQLIHHPPQLYDPNMPYQQPPVRVANANGKQTVAYGASPAVHGHLHYAYAFPPGAHPSLVQSQPPTAFYPPPPQPQHGSTVGVVHDANSLYMPVMPHPTLPNSEAESSDDESGEYSESDEEEGYTIVTMQKPSPYTEIKKKYEDLMKLYTKACKELTAAQAEISELKRKREATGSRGGFPQPSSSNSTLSPAVKKKKTESPISEPIRRTDLIPLGVDRNGNQRSAFQQLETSITSLPPPSTSVVPTSPSSDTSSSVSLNTLVYIYYYDGGCDGHGSRQLKANGKRIFIDINWDEIFKFRQDDCLHMCIFVNTSTVDKVKDSDLIATFKILRSDGDKVKISKIRENLRRLNLQNQFSHIGHIKFFIQIRGNDQLFDYTDKILLYSKTQHNIANFEPSNQKEYNELSKLFYQPERFTVFKKV